MCLFAPFAGIPALFGGAGAAAGGAAAAAGGAASAGSGLGAALQGLGALASAGGAIAGGISANNVAEYNAQVAENNAEAERQRAGYEAELMKDRKRQIIGAQRAAGAAAGLDITTGTPVAVLGDTAKQSEMDILARLYSGESAATAHQNDAANFRAEGKMQRTAGFISAGSSLLTNFGKLATSRSRYQPLYGAS